MELLLLSNSTLPGKAWLEHALPLIAEQLQGRRSAVFIPFAGVTQTWDDYTAKTAAVLAPLGVSVTGIHSVVDPVAAIENAEIVIVGGGNTFQLLKQCRERGLLAPITDVVKRGALYIGWSAGANLACPTIRTTNDMPIVDPQGFDALNLFPLLHLLSAVALLVWGTHIVRTGVMRVFGARLRTVLSRSVEKKPLAFCAGIGVTALVQSSNATTMLVTSFVAQDLVALAPALVIVLGADVGTALMARILTFDLSWLSPLLIFIGVIFFLGRKQSRAGQLGRVGIGLGLILLALELIVQAVTPITQANGVQVIFASLTGDILLDALIGAMFAIISYSSLAAVLLTATLTAAGIISFPVALCLVIGANLGSGLLAMLNNSAANAAARRVALGSLLFKLVGSLIILPFVHLLAETMGKLSLPKAELVIYFHVFYNLVRCLVMLPFVDPMARFCKTIIRDEPELDTQLRPKHLDVSALDTPTLALANAARETLRIGDAMEQMMEGLNKVMHGEPRQEKELRKLAMIMRKSIW
jgi:phosphate:Na+ symporter